MEREFVYTKDRLRFVLEDILERDVRDGTRYVEPTNAEEGFEKRAVLEFVLWFLEEAFPENFSFKCRYDALESDYVPEVAARIARGHGWSPGGTSPGATPENVVFVDFSKRPQTADDPDE